MNLSKVKVINFRCIDEATLHFQEGFNVVQGKNGAGKTSLIGAIGFGLLGSGGLKFPLNSCVKRDSVGNSYVLLEGTVMGEPFSVLRGLKPRKDKLILSRQEYSTRSQEITSFFERVLVSPRVFRNTLCCYQREVDLLVHSDSSTRRRFLLSLLQLSVIERAIDSISVPALKASASVLRQELEKVQQELDALPQVEYDEQTLREIQFLRGALARYNATSTEELTQLRSVASTLETLLSLIETAKRVDSQKCPLCGHDWDPERLVTKEIEVREGLKVVRARLMELPSPPPIDPEVAKRKLEQLPSLSDEECARFLEVLSKRRHLQETVTRLRSTLRELEESKYAEEAKQILREFYRAISVPLFEFLSHFTRRLLLFTPFSEFRITPDFEFYVGEEPVEHLSTAQRDFVMICFRIATTKVFLVSRDLEPLPLFLDSVGDALDDENFERLLQMLNSEELRTFSQVILTTHRDVNLGNVQYL